MVTEFDPFAIAAQPDPYPAYAELRARAPIYRSPQGPWVLSRYDHVQALLSDTRFAHWTAPPVANDEEPGLLARILSRWLHLMDPRNRSSLRKIVGGVLSPQRVKTLAGSFEGMADNILAPKLATGRLDLVDDFAKPFPLAVFSDFLGVPAAGQGKFSVLGNALVRHFFQYLSGAGNATGSDEAIRLFAGYIQYLIKLKQAQPGTDLVSALVEANAQGDEITSDDFMALCLIFLFVGYENIMNAIAICHLNLLRQPELLESLRQEPELIPEAVDELMRIDTSVQFVSLKAKEEIHFEGHVFADGDQVLLGLGAANRDPARFPEPDRIDFRRQDKAHLTFGHGPLFCVGASLARMEARTAITALLKLPGVALVSSEVEWAASVSILRGIRSLPVTFDAP